MSATLLRHRSLLLTALGVFIAIQVISHYWTQRLDSQIEQVRYQNLAHIITQDFHHQIQEKQAASTAIALTLANDVSHLLAENTPLQKNAFNRLIAEITQKSNYKNLWIQLIDVQGHSVYRNWTTQSHGALHLNSLPTADSPSQVTYQKDILTNRYDLVIQVTAPIYHQQKPVGYLRLISHFNSIQRYFEGKGIQSLAVVPPQQATRIQHPFSPHSLGGYYIANLTPNPALLNEITPENLQAWTNRPFTRLTSQNTLTVSIPIFNQADDLQGYFLVFYPLDISHQVNTELTLNSTQNLIQTVNISLSLLLLAGLVIFILNQQRDYFQRIINAEEEIVLVSTGDRMIDANQQLYNYFNTFRHNKNSCICDYFEPGDGYLQKQMGDQNWLEHLLNHPNEVHKAKCLLQDRIYIFKLKAHAFDAHQKLAVVILVDITELEQLNHRLLEQSRIDELTQIGNRRFFNGFIEREVRLAQQQGYPLSLIFFDIDHFKRVNDDYGHQIGDVALKTVARAVSKQLRDSDIFFRIGGEEFMIVLAHHPLEDAQRIAERLRKRVESLQDPKLPRLTISLGVSQLAQNETLDQLLSRTDEALYQAKSDGRNCVRQAAVSG